MLLTEGDDGTTEHGGFRGVHGAGNRLTQISFNRVGGKPNASASQSVPENTCWTWASVTFVRPANCPPLFE